MIHVNGVYSGHFNQIKTLLMLPSALALFEYITFHRYFEIIWEKGNSSLKNNLAYQKEYWLVITDLKHWIEYFLTNP